jgi:tRNA-specific 2-thiouridylase
VLGRHEGVTRYTVGQRRGLNVAVGEPLFVTRIDADRREVVVGPREALLTASLTLKETNWLGEAGSSLATAGEGDREAVEGAAASNDGRRPPDLPHPGAARAAPVPPHKGEGGLPQGRAVLARVRSTREPVPARLTVDGLVFDAPEEGVSPGQACVLYDPGAPSRVLGGGFIASTRAAV